MNKPCYRTLLGAVLTAISAAVYAQSNDDLIYAKTLKTMTEHEHSEHFVIWDTTISADAFSSVRVPRQTPEFQFTKYVEGVSPSLELSLIYNNLQSRSLSGAIRDDRLSLSVVGTTGFSGLLSSSELHELEQSTDQRLPDHATLAVGFSRIGYRIEGHQLHALVYAESGLLLPNGPYGGEGFCYVKQGNDWKLQGHAYLWQGDVHAFWSR